MLKKINNKGFTIIEVLIVLAIAGVIMLIVFLAVPALQRNSRNTQRKADVSASLASIQEAITNNNGQLPSTVAAGIANGKYGFYDSATEFTGSLTNAAAQTTITSTEGVVLQNFAKCPTTATAANTAAVTLGSNATKRNVAIVYRVETTGGYQAQCTDL